jgi:hypothetical protein
MENINEEQLFKVYEEIEKLKGDWYLYNMRDFDQVYENLMRAAGAIKKNGEFKDGRKWSKMAHKIHDACWDFFIKKCHEYLKYTKYYEKYYKTDTSVFENDEGREPES